MIVQTSLFKLPLDLDTLSEEERRQRLMKRKAIKKIVVKEEEEDLFNVDKYKFLWKSKKR